MNVYSLLIHITCAAIEKLAVSLELGKPQQYNKLGVILVVWWCRHIRFLGILIVIQTGVSLTQNIGIHLRCLEHLAKDGSTQDAWWQVRVKVRYGLWQSWCGVWWGTQCPCRCQGGWYMTMRLLKYTTCCMTFNCLGSFNLIMQYYLLHQLWWLTIAFVVTLSIILLFWNIISTYFVQK